MSSNIENLMTSLFGNQIQSLEDAMRTMYYRLDINRMEGDSLDQIGTLVNQARLGNTDAFYRLMLFVKIGINVSTGTIEEILTLWKLLAGTANVALVEFVPAKIQLQTDVYLADAVFVYLKSAISDAVAGGVAVGILVNDPTRFGFSPNRGNFGVSNWPDVY